MCKFLLSAASIFFLLAATLFPAGALAASRCSVRLPVTLLSLYRDSEFIYIGKYEKLEEGELINENDDYREVAINKHFSISSALKGETRKMITLSDSEYQYKDNQAVAEEVESTAEQEQEENAPEDGEDAEEAAGSEAVESEVSEEIETDEEENANEVRPGDAVLLFMRKDEDSDELVLSDYTDGMKKMTPEKLASYEIRIRELNEMFGGQKPSYSRVVAWLVRCAEDPQTRWEGTYELLRSFQTMDYEAELSKTPAPEQTAAESEEAGHGEDDLRTRKEFETGNPNFAKNLSEGEKLILTNVLLKRGRPVISKHTEDGSSFQHGDRELIDLVQRWADSKVAASLVEDLRVVSADTNLSSELMPSIAAILADKDLLSILASYTSIRWEDEAAEVEAETEEAEMEPVEESESPSESAAEVVEVSSEGAVAGSPTTADEKAENASPKVKKKTYGDLRKELITRFLARADKLIAKEGRAETHN